MDKSLLNTYLQSIQTLKSQKKIIWPFLIFASIEVIFLTLIYLAPRTPFSVILAPPIRTFRGEMFLHYPANFLLIPEASSFIRSYMTVFIGSLLSGTAVLMIFQAYRNENASFLVSLRSASRKYWQLFFTIFSLSIILHYLYKAVTFFIYGYFSAGHTKLLGISFNVWRGPILIFISVFFLLMLQALYLYAVPMLMIGNKKLLGALRGSLMFFVKYPRQTLLIAALPFLIYIPIIILQYRTEYLINNVFPEIVLYVAYASAILSSLVIDVLVTTSASIFYLNNKE